jgi:hypothetical protein
LTGAEEQPTTNSDKINIIIIRFISTPYNAVHEPDIELQSS